MTVAFSDGRVSFGTSGRVLVGHWRAPFSRERLRVLAELAVALHAREGERIGLLGVFEADAIELSALADDGLRRDAAKLQAELADKVRGGQSIVLEGTGFTVAALRGAALTLQHLSRAPERPVFHADVGAGLAWLRERLSLSPREAPSIVELLTELRLASGGRPAGAPP